MFQARSGMIKKKAFLLFTIAFLTCFSAKAHALCDEPKGAGAVFNDFKKIIVYFAYLPNLSSQKVADYPELLKHDKFKQNVVSSVRSNFSECLKKEGSTKEVIAEEQPTSEMADPDNLVVVIKLSYIKGHHPTVGAEEHGMLSYQFFRAGLTNSDALLVAKNDNGYEAIFPNQVGTPLDAQLSKFLSRIRPIKYPMPNPDSGYWNQMKKNWE